MGTTFLGIKQPGHEADQSHLSSVEVKNEYLQSPLRLHGVHKDDFTAPYNTAEHYTTTQHDTQHI